jgi:hypothetical protein
VSNINIIKTEYYKSDNRNFKAFFLGGEAASYIHTLMRKSFASPTDAISIMLYKLYFKYLKLHHRSESEKIDCNFRVNNKFAVWNNNLYMKILNL